MPHKYPICQQNTPAFQQKSPVNCTYDIAHYCFLLNYIQRALYLHKRALYFRKMPYELYVSHSALLSPLIHTQKSPTSSQKSPILPQKRPVNCTSYIELCCVAVCCSVLQCVAVRCSALQCVAVCCSVLQCVAVCCSVLQCVAVHYSVLQCVAVCCSVLQCVAVRCSVLQCVAYYIELCRFIL